MSRSKQNLQKPSQTLLAKLGPAASMFLATLLALPVNAGITLPTDPLTTASRVPPNILFLLDDSGSMAFNYMPDDVPSTSNVDISSQTYARNTLYYNPAITYQPWTQANGQLMTGGTSYAAVYGSFNYASGTTVDLGSSSSCVSYDYNSNGVDGDNSNGDRQICGGIQTFYVPKSLTDTSSAYLGDGRNYYRYDITNSSTIRRSVYGTVVKSNATAVAVTPSTGSVNNSSLTHTLATVPANVTLEVVIRSTNDRSKDYQLSDPAGNTVCNGSVDDGETATCEVDTNSGGIYTVRMSRNNTNAGTYSIAASHYTSNRCGSGTGSSGWINCTTNLPSARTVAAELQNYATWFSYHRTRMKTAKAGSSSAFSGMSGDVRMGFRTIWQRDAGTTPGNKPTFAVPIPVNYNGGVFSDSTVAGTLIDNRSQWYSRLFSTYGQNGTPLHGALQKAGEYFTDTTATGPYGPTTGADQLACRQNFTILATDGYYNNNANYAGGIDNTDGTNGTQITGPAGKTFTYTAAAPYSDAYGSTNLGGSNGTVGATLADVAMHYWKRDLRTDLSNIVPTTSANPAFWQHMVTFGIAIGLSGTVDQKSVAEVLADGNATVNGVAGWPKPVGDQNTTIDDLLHASVNGHGTFLSANDPMAFTNGLKAALATITERTGSFSNVAANSASLDTGAKLFQASYTSAVWTGDVLAYAKGTGSSFQTTASWKASEGIPTSSRRVFTSNAGVGTAFPTTAQTTALDRNATGDQYKVTGADNAAYIAGTRTLEIQNGGTLRNRNHLLGDIVSSSPFYVKDTDTLYVGANDGMLHAINAATGAELFAYVPNGIDLGQLSTLSRPDYVHRYFVDGPIVVSNRTQTPGANILVGALGKGGKGLFALNVGAPGTVASNGLFRWEVVADNDVSTASDNNVGLIQAKPVIARLNGGTLGLIVPNGINSTTGHAALLIYNLSTGALIREIDTGVGSPLTDNANSNGLTGAVGWDRDGSGTIDAIYGGDMLGNVWKFDLSSSASTSWGVASAGNPLFVAVGPDGTTRQPITGGPTLALHPSTYKTWVFFGTGRFMTIGDVNNNAVQSLYGFIDSGTTVAKADLTERKVLLTATSDGKKVRSFEQNAALPTNAKGWYINLVDPPVPPGTAIGERIVTPPQMDGTVLEVSSIIPTADACQSDGRGYLNAVDAFTGTSTSKPYFDVNGDGKFDALDRLDAPNTAQDPSIGSVDIGVGMVTQGALFSGGNGGNGQVCAAGSAGTVGCLGKNEVRNVGRVSWREVIRN